METDDQEQQKHRCKVCAKRFHNGRSLGGHMRSHVHSSPPITGEKEKLERSRVQVSVRLGYCLRENPKKTFRLSDFIGEDHGDSWKQCKQCGKAFPSCKALFGHMRCHSDKTCPRSFGDDEEEREKSMGEGKSSMGSFADDNEPLLPVPKRKRRSKRASPAIVSVVSSSSLSGYEPEQEEVAISLMMLSRDVSEFSDKNSWVLDAEEEEEDDSVDASMPNKIPISALLRKKRSLFCNNDNSFNGFNVMGSRFQCATCKKSFHSYHALGGHRANHKRSKSCCSQNTIFGVTGQHTPATAGKSSLHECDLCGKIFSSGQALGGHKRSHLVSNCGGENEGDDHQAAEVQNPVSAATADVSEQLDLNLPAPADELSSNLKAWWAGVRRT
ncbi:Zinc finger protein ZAT9 [Platanthera guangdongensis]|uniref:Zinc finger protein ZAT9 n=1 Tax=Platanthera guangdongensis TaxID=2320717 RepID=A0ABR2LW98_9ASPA